MRSNVVVGRSAANLAENMAENMAETVTPRRAAARASTNAAMTQWVTDTAHPLTTVDPNEPLADLEQLADVVGAATVVGLGRTTHGSHELSTLTHRLLRFLVERFGFRSLAVEENGTNDTGIDDYLRTGEGEPRVLLGDLAPHLRTEEFLDVLRWMRSYNEQNPDDPLRFVGVDGPALEVQGQVEVRLAENIIGWHEHTGHKVAYWGGIPHTAVAEARVVSFPPAPPSTGRSAGSYLRERFGAGYVSIGLTFHHGSVPNAVPAPAPGRVDAVLGTSNLNTFLLDVPADQPDVVRAGLDAPAELRLIGPRYDANHDADHHMSGGSLAEWFDVIIYRREATPTQLLG